MPISDGSISGPMICSQAVVERILGDESVTSVKIYNNIQSDNFVTGSAGWRIERNTGSVEFQDATIRGTLNASDLVSGTLDASVVTVTNLNASNITTGTLSADRIAANSLAIGKISGGTYGNSDITFSSGSDLVSSNYVAATSGWQIEGNGNAEFNNITVRGTIYATAGEIGGLDIVNNLTLETGGVIRTNATGQRIEITNTVTDGIRLYSGNGSETSAGLVVANESASRPRTRIASPTYSGSNFNTIDLYSGYTTNDIHILANDYDISLQAVSGDINLTAGGAVRLASDRLDRNTTGAVSIYGGGAGSAGTPTYSFYDDTDSGIYRVGADQVGIATGGNTRVRVGTSYLIVSAGTLDDDDPRLQPNGSITSPAYSFRGDTNTGMWRAAADEIGLTAGGAEMFTGLNTATDEVRILPAYNNSASGDATVGVTSTGLLRRQTSAAKYKTNIRPAPQLADIELRPVEYDTIPAVSSRDADAGVRHLYGLIADELADQDRDLARFSDDGVEDFHDRAVLAILAAKVNRLEAAVGI